MYRMKEAAQQQSHGTSQERLHGVLLISPSRRRSAADAVRTSTRRLLRRMSYPARSGSQAGYAVYLPACVEVYDGEAGLLGDADVSVLSAGNLLACADVAFVLGRNGRKWTGMG